MRIKAIYTPDKEAYDIEADEQRMTIPKPFMAHFISVCQIAHHRQREKIFSEIIRKAKEKEQAARKLIEDSNHPAILPFVKKDPEPPPEKRPQGRPKGISTPKKQKPKPEPPPPKEQEAPPFKHTPFR